MWKLCYYFVFVCVVFGVTNGGGEDYDSPDYWEMKLGGQWSSGELEKLGILDKNEDENNNENNDKFDSVETGDWNEELDVPADLGTAEVDVDKELLNRKNYTDSENQVLEDYQYEDNRQEPYEDNINYNVPEINIGNSMKSNEDTDLNNNLGFHNFVDYEEIKPLPLPPTGSVEDTEIDDDSKFFLNKYNDNFDDLAAEESRQVEVKINDEKNNFEENDNINKIKDDTVMEYDSASIENKEYNENSDEDMIVEETKNLLSSMEDSFTDEKQNNKNIELEPLSDEEQRILDETKDILNETDDAFDENNSKQKSLDNVETKTASDEDTLDKAKADLDADLNKLFNIWDKLNSDDVEDTKLNSFADMDKEEPNPDDTNFDYVKDYEDKYNRPFREGLVVDNRHYDDNPTYQNEDYYDINHPDSSYEVIDDSNLSEIFSENSKQQNIASNLENDTLNEKESSDMQPDVEIILKDRSSIDQQIKIPYINDSIVNSDTDQEMEKIVENSTHGISTTEAIEDPIPTKNVEDLTDEEYDSLMQQFVLERDSTITPVDCDGNPGPIMINLTPNVPTEVFSCNYPGAYPTNRVTDWVLQGDGSGMDIKIKALDTNGILQDYLLLKPGSLDETGSNGILFSYHLDHERKYRFLDINKLFIRFDVKVALAYRTGFLIEVTLKEKFTSTVDEVVDEEPEPILPSETIAVHLGGVNLTEFARIEEEFRLIVADMATYYMHAHNIDLGLNTTAETTNVTRKALCSHTWPDYENCVQVTFGVPLVYEDEISGLTADQLNDMWSSYITIDPFAARMSRLSITEFNVPNDKAMLSMWLVIAAGVLISAALLAVALWRFSCFEDYTRMAPFSDNESFTSEKPVLDLYPTPHQPLPPLYSEADYKWVDSKEDSTRVDIGGFANRSFCQEDLFNLDSDDDVTIAQRGKDIRPKDAYEV